jgi:gamma-glutamyltranspeptidase
MTVEDRTSNVSETVLIEDYSAVIREPVNITYRGFKIHSCPAPSSGRPWRSGI